MRLGLGSILIGQKIRPDTRDPAPLDTRGSTLCSWSRPTSSGTLTRIGRALHRATPYGQRSFNAPGVPKSCEGAWSGLDAAHQLSPSLLSIG